VGFEKLLHHEAAHGMTNQRWDRCKLFHDLTDIVDVVGNRTAIEWCRDCTRAVPAKAQRDGAVAPIREEIQKMIIPAPSCMPRTVNEKQRRRMSITAGPFVDQFEHWAVPPIEIASATEW
jgi:hypothetical protein